MIGNNPILIMLFISMLQGVAFEWFQKLFSGYIKSWSDLETLYLICFYEDDTKVKMNILNAEKQKVRQHVKKLTEVYRNPS